MNKEVETVSCSGGELPAKVARICLVSDVLLLAGCGGGSSSGGGGQFAKDCVESKLSEDIQNIGTVFTNSCSFGVNVRSLAKKPQTEELYPPFVVRANSNVFREEIVIIYGACRRPSVPEPREDNGFKFRCV